MSISFREGSERLPIDVGVPVPDDRLVLKDADGREHHFGCGVWTSKGTFIYVATYGRAGREKIFWWEDILEPLSRGWEIVQEPALGPQLTPLAHAALASIEQSANKVNGFVTDYEKTLAVRVLRALWDEAREPLDPDEVEVWAATHGWAFKGAKTLREIAEGVRNGKQFRGAAGGRAIRRDREQEKRMVENWRDALGGADTG